ncbi:MAG: hypothetical protein ABI852_07835 [Gemmatimonadaceae bacterium]
MKRLSTAFLISCTLAALPLGAQSVIDSTGERSVVRELAPSSVEQFTDAVSDSTPGSFVQVKPVGVLRLKANLLAESLNDPNHLLSQPDTGRRKAVKTSEWYSRRLTLHRYGSYVMLPLFVTQFVLGNKLLNQKEDLYATPARRQIPVDANLRSTHAAVAGAVGLLFLSNTTTGVWNYLATRHNVEGRKLRTIHALTMLLADAGFAYTGYLGSQAKDHGIDDAHKHRNAGLTSFGIATVGASLMWFRKD